MATPADLDPALESLLDEQRALMLALNELYHPVFPGDPRRVQELERRVAETRVAVSARKAELRN
jgi:hypothetical protein